MSITNSAIVKIINKPNGFGIYEHHTDQLGKIHDYRYYTDGSTDNAAELAAHALLVDANLAPVESEQQTEELKDGGAEAVPVYQAQADIDRRTLGRLMMEDDPRVFLNGLVYFQAVEIRGGANAVQRSAYLGVPLSEYQLIAARFGDVQGVAFFLTDDKNQIWDTLPPEYL